MDLNKLARQSRASQDEWEMYQMLRAVSEIEPMVVVEVGVDGGGSLETWQKAFKRASVIGIDLNQRAELQRYQMIYGDSKAATTVDYLKDLLKGRPIDFLFIDGDHNYQAVKDDFYAYMGLVRPGGIIGFHDTNNRGIEGVDVDQFMREMDNTESYRTMDLRADNMSPGTRLIWL